MKMIIVINIVFVILRNMNCIEFWNLLFLGRFVFIIIRFVVFIIRVSISDGDVGF